MLWPNVEAVGGEPGNGMKDLVCLAVALEPRRRRWVCRTRPRCRCGRPLMPGRLHATKRVARRGKIFHVALCLQAAPNRCDGRMRDVGHRRDLTVRRLRIDLD